jgi:hypothetical protein
MEINKGATKALRRPSHSGCSLQAVIDYACNFQQVRLVTNVDGPSVVGLTAYGDGFELRLAMNEIVRARRGIVG